MNDHRCNQRPCPLFIKSFTSLFEHTHPHTPTHYFYFKVRNQVGEDFVYYFYDVTFLCFVLIIPVFIGSPHSIIITRITNLFQFLCLFLTDIHYIYAVTLEIQFPNPVLLPPFIISLKTEINY